MAIYYLLLEAVPDSRNPERLEFGGAYVNCWVKAANKKEAALKAGAYINEEGWNVVKTLDTFIAQKQLYLNEPESAACYDEACEMGLSAIFHTWDIDAE